MPRLEKQCMVSRRIFTRMLLLPWVVMSWIWVSQVALLMPQAELRSDDHVHLGEQLIESSRKAIGSRQSSVHQVLLRCELFLLHRRESTLCFLYPLEGIARVPD